MNMNMNIKSIFYNIFNYVFGMYKKLFNKKKWYIIEGNIGSGKSVLLEKLKEHIDCEIIPEPVAVWQSIKGNGKNILEQFYQNPSRYAYLFQTIVFKTRLQALEPIQQKQIRFSERSIWTDKYVFGKACIESNTMNELEKNAYYLWFDWLADKYFKNPDGIILLDCPSDICLKRLNNRGRHEESTISIDYLNIINSNHSDWLKSNSWTKTDVLVIDNKLDNDWDNIINKIKIFIKD